MTGLADLRRWAEQPPRLAHIAVALAEVDTVSAQTPGERHAVIDDEGDAGVSANALQRLGEARELMLIDVLHPKLEGGGNPWLERCPQPVRKCSADVLRADQIELRRFGALGRREIERVELIHSSSPPRKRRSRFLQQHGKEKRDSRVRGNDEENYASTFEVEAL